jgi:hypothetical protein
LVRECQKGSARMKGSEYGGIPKLGK